VVFQIANHIANLSPVGLKFSTRGADQMSFLNSRISTCWLWEFGMFDFGALGLLGFWISGFLNVWCCVCFVLDLCLRFWIFQCLYVLDVVIFGFVDLGNFGFLSLGCWDFLTLRVLDFWICDCLDFQFQYVNFHNVKAIFDNWERQRFLGIFDFLIYGLLIVWIFKFKMSSSIMPKRFVDN
jgi:hypothetical protein